MLAHLLATFCLFSPPQGFDMVDPKTPSRHAIVGFIQKGRSGFCPSLHLTHESITCAFDQYLKQVSQQAAARGRKWRNLGEIETKSGKATLIQIELDHNLGRVALLQAILPREGEVHILTAGVLKKELSKQIHLFRTAFQSMRVVEDLFELASDPEELKGYWKKKGEDVQSFHKAVLKEKSPGPVWQVHLLKQ